MFQLNAATGAIQHTFATVPSGCTGAGVWGSPTIDTSAGTVFFVTGNNGGCSTSEPYSFALMELHTSDLSIVDHYQLPQSARPGDSDFGSTPTLFTNSSGSMLGVPNKNGVYYAFNRANIHAVPVWTKRVANQGDCPQCGNGSISPSAWDGTYLYLGGGNTTIAGTGCQGGVRKLNPNNGQLHLGTLHARWASARFCHCDQFRCSGCLRRFLRHRDECVYRRYRCSPYR
jgi:hypothetical protein